MNWELLVCGKCHSDKSCKGFVEIEGHLAPTTITGSQLVIARRTDYVIVQVIAMVPGQLSHYRRTRPNKE